MVASGIAVACILVGVLQFSRDSEGDEETTLSYLGASEEYAASKVLSTLYFMAGVKLTIHFS
jgi:hypothetical protein